MKEAFDATRRLPGIRDATTEEIRAALRAALAARGIHDFPDRSLDPMTRAIQTSRASVLADYALTGVERAREGVAWLKEHQTPEWLAPPQHAVPAQASTRVDRTLGQVDLEPRDLPLLTRLLAEVRPADPAVDVDGREQFFPCWLDLADPHDPRSAVVVHVGKQRLGRLGDDAADMVRPELSRLARRRKALLASAELDGSTPDTVSVELRLLTRG